MSSPNVLLLVLDSLRRDRLPCYGYDGVETPTLDELSNRGVPFEDAYATGPWTVPVHGSLFTGKRPTESGVHRKNKHLQVSPRETLAGVLADEGYDTAGFSANPWINPEFGYDAGFDSFFDLTPKPPFEGAGDPRSNDWEANGRFETLFEYLSWMKDGNPIKRFVNGVYFKKFFSYPLTEAEAINDKIVSWFDDESESPSFVFANYMDVHEPYRFREDHLPADSSVEKSQFRDPENIDILPRPTHPEAIDDLYDAALSHLDARLGELIEDLRKSGHLDDTVLVLLGDHGQCLGEHDYWGHGTFLFDELVRIPLLVVPFSDMELDVDPSRPVSVADLPRFISSMVGTSFDDATDHTFAPDAEPRPIVAESRGPRPVLDDSTVASAEGYRAVYFAGQKLLRDFTTGEITFEGDATVSDEVCDELREFEASLHDDLDVVRDDQTISEDREEMLRELGYL